MWTFAILLISTDLCLKSSRLQSFLFSHNFSPMRSIIDAIYTVLSKAFDQINHGILFYKLQVTGFCERLFLLIKSYYNNRLFFVRYVGFRSLLDPDVPQFCR